MSYQTALGALRTWLEANLAERWSEARKNEDDNPIGFPLWRVEYQGASRRGDTWKSEATVIVVAGFVLEVGNETALETAVAELVETFEANPSWIVRSVGGAEGVTLGGKAVYAASRVTLEKT